METATRDASAPQAAPGPEAPSRLRRAFVEVAGPAAIVFAVLISLRGFAFLPRLTSQHPDLVTFWLPRSCLLGDALRDGRVPLWNPFEMAGTPFAADTQSGWLSLATMASSWAFGCGGALRVMIVVYPILAGLGLWWFLRREALGQIAATAGGVSLAMAVAASSIAISMPFSGTLAGTPFALVGASGFFSASGWRRLPWLALSALAWGQVATAHLSHGLVICTALVAAYVIARAVAAARGGTLRSREAGAFAAGFLAFLPLANLAILIPRFALLQRSSLRAGYGALEGTVAGLAGIEARPIPDHGIWSAWPLALASTPGAYLGAAILLCVAFALRERDRRPTVVALGAVGILCYLLTLTALVGAGWFRGAVQALPFGDVYLHNPGRLRYAAFVVVPALGAIGIQSLLDRPPAFRRAVRWLAVGLGIFFAFPLVAGARPQRLLVFAAGAAAVVGVVWLLSRGWRWAPAALAVVLVAELLVGALWSSSYRGGTVYLGLESGNRPALLHGPLRWPGIDLNPYLEPGVIARELARRDDGRYLAWIPPAAYFNKGYLFSQQEPDWPALLLGRAILFDLEDALGYSPIQVPRYWSYIRATNELPVFYNASVIQEPSVQDVRLLRIRYLIVHEGQTKFPPGIHGEVVASEAGYRLLELDAAQPRVSVVPEWRVVNDGALALEAALRPDFDPALVAVVEGDPGLAPQPGTTAGSATYRELRPEEVVIDVDAPGPSIVVIRNTWERGWSATVAGRPARLLRANSFLQAVPVPEGAHEIRLVYREPAIGRGLIASAVVWAGVAIVLGLAARRVFSGTSRPGA
ncbi:MAG TPA: hypothetical protein VLA90_00020 [Actinomycetota bacterium]|nr:hypothetical protein [Actinomycetota bacterium]